MLLSLLFHLPNYPSRRIIIIEAIAVAVTVTVTIGCTDILVSTII